MSAETWGVVIGFAVYIGMKFIDRLFPDGTHFTFMDRFLSPDKKPKKKYVDRDTDGEST